MKDEVRILRVPHVAGDISKFLGVTIEKGFSWIPHIVYTNLTCRLRVNDARVRIPTEPKVGTLLFNNICAEGSGPCKYISKVTIFFKQAKTCFLKRTLLNTGI